MISGPLASSSPGSGNSKLTRVNMTTCLFLLLKRLTYFTTFHLFATTLPFKGNHQNLHNGGDGDSCGSFCCKMVIE